MCRRIARAGGLGSPLRGHATRARSVAWLVGGLVMLTAACGQGPGTDNGGGVAADDGAGGYAVEDQPAGAAAMFVSPQDGETVRSPVELAFEVEGGVELVAAGEPAVGEGHLHVLVDRGCFDTGETIPGPGEQAQAAGIFHFAGGSAEGQLELEPGEHELCLQLGDGLLQAFGEPDEITITVQG